MQLNGTSQYGWVDNPTFKTDTVACFSFWIKLNALLTVDGLQTIIGYGVNSAGNNATFNIGVRRYLPATGTGTYLSVLIRATHGGVVVGYAGTTTPLVAGAWMYCEVEDTGSAWAMRINNVSQTMTINIGVSANTGGWLGDISGASHKLVIGNSYNSNALGSTWFAGVVDEINYFSAITGAQSTLMYNGGTPINPHRVQFGSAWKSWWRCGDSRDTNAILYDEIGTNNITLVNTPTLVTP